MKCLILLFLILALPTFVLANSPPVLETIKTQSLEVGKEFNLLVGHTDPDGGELALSDDSDLFEITAAGLIKFIPRENQIGIHEFTIKISDKEFETSTKGKFIINKNLTDVKIDPQIIRINTKQFSNITKQITIENPTLDKIYLVAESKSDSIFVKPTNVEIEKSSIKTIELSVPSIDIIQTGSIAVYGGKKEKIIPVIITSNSGDSNLGLSLDIAAKFRKLEPGEEIAGDLTIINLNKTKVENLDVTYLIKDLQNNEIIKSTEQVSVEKELKKTKKLSLPSFIGQGDYIFGVIIKKRDKIESTAEFFSISKEGNGEKTVQYIPSNLQVIISVVIIILVSILLYLNYGRLSNFEKKKSAHAERIYKEFLEDKQSIEKAQETKKKLEKQIESLEKAYKMKVISEESYNKGKKRIEDLIKKINKNLKK